MNIAQYPNTFLTWGRNVIAIITMAFASLAYANGFPDGYLVVANERGASLTIVNPASGSNTTQALTIAPHNVQVSANNQYILAVGDIASAEHSHGENAKPGLLVVFSVDDLTSEALHNVEVGEHPAHVVTDQSGQLAFITNAGDNTLSVVDLRTGQNVNTIATGAYPHGLRLSPDGEELYVANVMDGSVSVIDVDQQAEVARIPVGQTPVQVGFTPDGSQVYVSLRDEDKVAVIDTAQRLVIDTISVGHRPIQVHSTSNGSWMLVANEGSKANPDNRLSIIDIAKKQTDAIVTVGNGAHGITVDDTARFAFVTNLYDDNVSMIDLTTHSVVSTFPTDGAPNGVTWVSR